MAPSRAAMRKAAREGRRLRRVCGDARKRSNLVSRYYDTFTRPLFENRHTPLLMDTKENTETPSVIQESLTHFDASGQAHMVDVGAKIETHRVALATGT